jgi:hypothetical protein
LLNDHIKGLSIVSSLLAIAGIVLMFSSINFATSLGEAWLLNHQAGGNKYHLMVETYKNNFIIIGSVLFGAGILTAILAYFYSGLYVKKENKDII